MSEPGGMPSVSVVIAAYNASRFVGATLASLAGQVLLPEEVIVVDDASTDDTLARVRPWDDRLPLRVISLDRNAGAGAARAQAMRDVTTPLACFVDADDVVHPDHLDHLVRLWCRHRAGSVISPRALIWDGGTTSGDYHRSLGLTIPRRHQLAGLIAANYVFYGALFEVDRYRDAGGMRDLRLSEDWDLWVRLAANGAQFQLAERATMLYRRHPGNVTGAATTVDVERARLARAYRSEHPEWLTVRQWHRALRHGAELSAARRGLLQLAAGDVNGIGDVASLGRHSAAQLARQTTYFALRKLGRRAAPNLQRDRGPRGAHAR